MNDYVFLVVFWLVPPLAVAAYLFTRRLLPHSRSLFMFDSTVLCVVALLCVGLWWREITGHISQDIWLDEYEFMLLLVPMWSSIISVPLLLVATNRCSRLRAVVLSTFHMIKTVLPAAPRAPARRG